MELIKEETTPEDVSRGRQRDNLTSVVSSKQVQRNQLEICPGLVSGDTHPMCRGRDRSDPEPKTGDAASDGGFPVEKTSSETQGGKSDSGCTEVNAEGLSDGRQGKKKHRRRASKKKRRWKPYFKLTWEEKKELDERETARASRVRAEMFAKGLPVAPYNTTQFLMEEHDREEPDLNTELGGRRSGAMRSDDTASEEENFEAEEEEEEDGGGGGSSDGMGRTGQAGGEFLQKDFSETYERYHVETLQNMSKQELVREYLELEKCMSRLEEENNWLRHSRRNPEASDDGAPAYGAQRVQELEIEVERLRAENNELLLKSPKTKGPGLNQSQPC
ncbi:protein HEXIM1 [Paramisgurnus dabryanus]|uniref:protein HEXIM1 n=1 Tax=Paramisgurnus dabryanus TaxID=90735 RepID=UPI0031F3BCB4